MSAEQRTHGHWGVWDQHLRAWVVSGCASERDAWVALLAAESLHPWELVVREAESPKPAAPPLVDCPVCDGLGECPTCDQTCPRCDGDGKVEEERPRRSGALARVG